MMGVELHLISNLYFVAEDNYSAYSILAPYCDESAESIDRQRLGKHTTTDGHANRRTSTSRPCQKCAHAKIGRVFPIGRQQPAHQWTG
jgi:hypothetical protein